MKQNLCGRRAAMAVSLILLTRARAILIFLLLHVCSAGDCLQVEPDPCESGCAGFPGPDFLHHQSVRYTYRYRTSTTTTLRGSGAGRSGLALDCVVDIDRVSECHLMMQIRNAQIKRLSPQREHSVLSLKTLRESLERKRLKFSLRGGKVTALCLQEGEQVWALNIKRALLSMLQTSLVVTKVKEEKETDIHGTCSSRYERRGAVLMKTRDLKRCQQSRLDDFWPHSVTLADDTSFQMELHCVQRQGGAMMEEVNCTEVVSVETWSGTPGVVKTQTTSTLVLLRAQPGGPLAAPLEPPSTAVLTHLQFEDEEASAPGNTGPSTLQRVAQTVRVLCSLSADPQLVSRELLQLVLQLKGLTLSQLQTLWEETSFKCRNDWQPLLDGLMACGSESCIVLLTDLIRDKELEEGQALSFLTAAALIPHPSPRIIGSITALLDIPGLRSQVLLAGSSLVYQLCHRTPASSSELPQVQGFIQTLEKSLSEGCEGGEPGRVGELFYVLKSVGNAGLSAPAFIPLLNLCILGRATRLELKLAGIQAFRRFPCSADRSVLLQLYGSSQEDPEVRIAAYQQLMLCPGQAVFEVVKATLARETSSQVGSFVWSHLTGVLRSEDPMKQAFIESMPDDIVSRDFEKDFLKYSSYSEHTFGSGVGVKNVETSLIFSPKSFLPRSASANVTVYFHGRAHNLLDVELHIDNFEPLLKSIFGDLTEKENGKPTARTSGRKAEDGRGTEKEGCLSSSYLNRARAMLLGRRNQAENRPKCWVGVKVFGNELSVFTCDDIYNQVGQISLSAAGLAVKLLKGHEVQLSRRAVPLMERLVLPSLSGLPLTLSVNMTSILSLRLKGGVDYRDVSHFLLDGYIKPNAYVGLSARMGVHSVLGRAAVEWAAELRSSTSLDGSIRLQEGRDLRVTLNTPEDLMDVISLSSRVFQLSGDHREEIKGPKSRVQKTSCTPKTWSKMMGWQLCSNTSLPSPLTGLTLPPPGPLHLSLSLLKLDRGLHLYVLEAAYSLHHQRGTWFPRDGSVHLLLATPQSSVPRDVSLDLAFSPHRLLLRIVHPMKQIHLQGQLEQERNIKSGKLELVIDGSHYYVMGLVDTHTLLSEWRRRYHLEVKLSPDENPMILSANVTRGLGWKSSLSATAKNVLRETASLSVVLERRKDSSSRRYSLEAELLLPGVVGSRMLGLMEQRPSMWNSMIRLKYGLGDDARHLRQECYTSQRLRSGRDSNFTSVMRADHEFYCTNTAPINHKIRLRHEKSSRHIKSVLDVSYGEHWDEINNKHTLLLSQSFRNQSTLNDTSYALEFSLRVPERGLDYRTQLVHAHQTQPGLESSTHLTVNYNDLPPLVAGLHWSSSAADSQQRTVEGTVVLDTPWLYVRTAHKLSRLRRHTLQLTSELTATKWLTVHNLVLEAWCRDRGGEKEARLALYSPAATYLQAELWGAVGKRALEASGSLCSLWTRPLRGNVSLDTSQTSHALQMNATYGGQNLSVAAALTSADKSLKKRQATLKMSFTKPASPAAEVELEAVVEELRRDKKMYQKTAVLHLRQPLQILPQALLLRETFTVDLLQGLYILETRAGIHSNREVIHTLTLGYKPSKPFVCSALIHPFSSETVPSDSEICVTVTSNQTHKDVRGRLRVGGSERLTFLGLAQTNPWRARYQALQVKATFSHQLQLQLPSSAVMEGLVRWTPEPDRDFDYQARGRLRVGRQECQLAVQLNGTSGIVGLQSSLSHPFKSKIPKTLEVRAAADVSVPGRGSSTVHVSADGKDRVMLNAQVSHILVRSDRAVGLRLNLSQSLLPAAADLHLNLAANTTSDSVVLRGSFTRGEEALLAQLRGSLTDSPGLRLALSGDLRHSLTGLSVLPPVLGLDGALGRSDGSIKGKLRVEVMETVHSVELRHQTKAAGDEEGMMGEETDGARDWLCVRSGMEHLCVNVSRQLANQGRGEVFLQLCHSSHLLNVTGVPVDSSAQVKWSHDGEQLSVLAELQAGPEYLEAEFLGGRTDPLTPRWQYSSRLQHQVQALLKRGLMSSLKAKAHYQLEAAGLDTGLVLHSEDEKVADVLLNVGSNNKTTILVVSLWQRIKLLQRLMPTSLQMNCAGEAAADGLSARCSGHVENGSVEVRASRSWGPHSRPCLGLALTHASLSARAKACFRPRGRRELRVRLSHSSVLLGVPKDFSVRVLLRAGLQRLALGVGMVVGPWRTNLSVGLKSETPGLYGWHGLLEYGTDTSAHKAAVTGGLRLQSWCDVWADAGVAWDSFSSTVRVSGRCSGVLRLAWVQVGSTEGNASQKTSLMVEGRARRDGVKGSLRFENQHDSLWGLVSAVLKPHQAEVSWSLRHRRGPAAPTLPTSGVMGDTGVLAVPMATTASQAHFGMESDVCSVRLLAAGRGGGGAVRGTTWTLFVHQRCVLVESLLPPQASVNVSITRSGGITDLSTTLQTGGTQHAALSLSLVHLPPLSLRASVQLSPEARNVLQFPSRAELLLNVSSKHLPGVAFGLELGPCSLRGDFRKTASVRTDAGASSYTADVTSYCPLLQAPTLPVSVALRGVLSVTQCQLTVSSSLRADNQTLSLDLVQSCRTPRLHGTFSHSVRELGSLGLPQSVTIEAAAPQGPGQAGGLLIRVGACDIRASRVTHTGGTGPWLWAVESKCPALQVHLNGSVVQHLQGVWTVALDTTLGGGRAFIRLNAKSGPELSVEGELDHDVAALTALPKSSRLRLSTRSGRARHGGEVLLQVGGCAVGANGELLWEPGLQWSLDFLHNCTVVQERGCPGRVQASGSLLVSADSVDFQINATVDDTTLQSLLALRKTEDQSEASLHLVHSVARLRKLGLREIAAMTMSSERHGNGSYAFTLSSNAGNQKLIQEIAVAKTSETVRVRGDFRHTVDHLKKLGVPANSHILVEVASAEGRTLAVQSWCGHQEAGLTLDVKSFPLSREIRGLVWHSWPWLRDAGLPFNTEGRCSVQGASSQLQFNTQLTVAGHQLLTSGVNVSAADGHLAALLSYCPPGFNQTGTRHELDAVLTAQFKGPLRGVSLDVSSLGRRVRVVGDVGGWGTHGGTKEAKVTLKHTVQGRRIPVVQVEAWGRLTDSQLRCSMAVNPELSSSLALIVQGRRVPHSKDLMVKVAHNTPRLLLYVPSQLNIRSQLNQSESSVAGLLELVSGRRRLWALGELAAIEGGFTQTVEVKHSCPQLKSLPRAVAVRTAYETRKWSYHVQQAAVWGNHEFSLSALYSAPPALDLGNQTLRVQLRAVPRRTCLEVMLERSSHARLHSVSLDWTRHGRLEQAKVVSEWSVSEERNETKLDLQQPFSSSLSKLSLQTVSHSSQRDQRSSHQAHLSWESAVPANVSVSLHQQWQSNSSRGQLCALLSALQPAASSVKGCVSVAQEGDTYSQNAELRWGNSTVKQGVKYQKNLRGMHSLQLLAGLDRVSPEPCPSHTLLAKVQTNLRDRLEHTVLLSICPAQPALSWSGSHRLKSGEELLYTESRLSVTGRPHECSFTLAITNSSTPQGLNMSLFSETRVGNWSVEMGGAALSWSGGSSLRVQAGLDHQEKIWLNGTLGGRCLQTTAGFTDGLREQLSAAVCVGVDHALTMNVQRRDGSNGSSSLGRMSLGASGRRFTLRASGCLESLTAAEERIHYLSSRIQNKLVERIRRLQQFIAEFRKQSRDSRLLQELSAVPLHVSEQVEALLERGARGPLGLWHRSPLRHALTSSLPRFLGLLQHASLLGQQELRRPLATLAGVYQDVTGQRLEEVWRETVLAWTDTLVDVLAALLEKNPHLKTLSQAAAAALTTALDLAGQQTYSWTETRLASALPGVRKQLASLYKFSSRECAVSVSVPLPHVSSLRAAEAELTEILLEEWLLRPLQALAAVRPSAEFYRLKRKMMDSPFIHQALLVAGRFVVTFDGRLYELPALCPLLLAQDVGTKRSFTLVLNSDSDTFLLVHLNNHTISIQHTGEVKVDCSNAVSHTFSSDDGLTVSKGSNIVQVSSQHGPSLSCDPSFQLCSFTLDGWSHGASTGLLGTNDNDAFNDFPLHDGSQAAALEDFFHSWQLRPKCIAPPDTADPTSTAAPSLVSCSALFSSPDSPLGACFRVVDPGQFLSVCQLSSSRAPCRLAAAFVHLCKQNYIPLEVPVQCMTA